MIIYKYGQGTPHTATVLTAFSDLKNIIYKVEIKMELQQAIEYFVQGYDVTEAVKFEMLRELNYQNPAKRYFNS